MRTGETWEQVDVYRPDPSTEHQTFISCFQWVCVGAKRPHWLRRSRATWMQIRIAVRGSVASARLRCARACHLDDLHGGQHLSSTKQPYSTGFRHHGRDSAVGLTLGHHLD